MYKSPWRCSRSFLQSQSFILRNLVVTNTFSKPIVLSIAGGCGGIGSFLGNNFFVKGYSSPITIPSGATFTIRFDPTCTPVTQLRFQRQGDRNPIIINAQQFVSNNLAFTMSDQDLSDNVFDFAQSVEGYPCTLPSSSLLELPLRYMGNNEAWLGDINFVNDDVSILNNYYVEADTNNPQSYGWILELQPSILKSKNPSCPQSSWTIYVQKGVIETFLQNYVSTQFNQGVTANYRYCKDRICPSQKKKMKDIENLLQSWNQTTTNIAIYDQIIGNSTLQRRVLPLMKLTRVRNVRWEVNEMNDRAWVTLFDALPECAPRLGSLFLIKNVIGVFGIHALCRYITLTSVLTHFACTEMPVGDMLVEALEKNTSIQHLHLSQTGITGEQVARIVSSNCTVQEIHLCDNPLLDATGAKALATALCTSRYLVLRELCLAETNIGLEGLKDFLYMLQHNTTLQHLSLPFVEHVGQDIAELAAITIKTNTTLRSLTMHLDFDHCGVDTILEVLPWTSLVSFEMSCRDDDVVIHHIKSSTLCYFKVLGAGMCASVDETLRDNKKRSKETTRKRNAFVAGIESPIPDLIQRLTRALK